MIKDEQLEFLKFHKENNTELDNIFMSRLEHKFAGVEKTEYGFSCRDTSSGFTMAADRIKIFKNDEGKFEFTVTDTYGDLINFSYNENKLNKYRVSYTSTMIYYVEVEASTEDEAIELADERMENQDFDNEDNSYDYDFNDIELLS